MTSEKTYGHYVLMTQYLEKREREKDPKYEEERENERKKKRVEIEWENYFSDVKRKERRLLCVSLQ